MTNRHLAGRAMGALMALPIILSGCSGGGATSAPSEPARSEAAPSTEAGQPSANVDVPDPCGLLNSAEIESVIGNGVGQGSSGEGIGTRTCSWASPNGNASGRSVAIELAGPTEIYSARQLFDAGRTEIAEGALREIPSLGDAAFGAIADINGGTVVRVVKGDLYLTLRVGEATAKTEEHLTMAVALARKAVARM